MVNRGVGFCRHEELVDPFHSRFGKVDEAFPLRRDGEIGHGDVTNAFAEAGNQLVAGNRYEHHMVLEVTGLVLLVDEGLELDQRIV